MNNMCWLSTTPRRVFVKYAEFNILGTVSSGILKTAFEGQKIDLESMAAQFLASEVGNLLSDVPMVKDIGKGIQDVVKNNPMIRSIVTDVHDVIDEALTKIETAVDHFFDPVIASPNAQAPATVVKPKVSQAKAMSRYGLHAQPRALNRADASGNYLGANLGIPDDPTIDSFDPNGYPDNSSVTVSGSSVNKVPSTNGSLMASKPTFLRYATQELINEVQEMATYLKPAGESLKIGGENNMSISNEYSHLLKGVPNPDNFATRLPESQIEPQAFTEQVSRAAAASLALGLSKDAYGRTVIAAAFGLQLKVAYDNVEAAPPEFRTLMEAKEYGGIAFGGLVGAVGEALVPRAPVVGAVVGDLVGISLWKGAFDYFEPQLAPHIINPRNGF